jgi:hypothetical protein
MPDGDDKDQKQAILDLAEDAVIAHPITPKARSSNL